jgi:hypothetical protein
VHVTLRAVTRFAVSDPTACFPPSAVRRALGTSSHASFRVLQFTVQNDHVHLIVEAD